jgi:lysylphosphatidylglycerol synthetase-like protein (DUF2156 family)
MIEKHYINHPSGFLACSELNVKFTVPHLDGFVSYRKQGKFRIALGGVHCLPSVSEALLTAFLTDTKTANSKVLFVQVPQHQVALFVAAGAVVNRLGATFALDLRDYSLRGTPKIALRNKIHRARRAGLKVVEFGRDALMDPSLATQIAKISASWLRKKGKKEIAFMVGNTSDSLDNYRRTFIALDDADVAMAYITYVPAWGVRAGYLHDLSRRLPEAPPGTMELINSFAIEQFQREAVAYLHFGFTPFVLTGEEPSSASGFMAKICQFLYTHGRLIYPAKSQSDYKRKWGTDVVEPEFIAGFPISLPAIFALLRLTRSL